MIEVTNSMWRRARQLNQDSRKSEPERKPCYAMNSLPQWGPGRLNSADGVSGKRIKLPTGNNQLIFVQWSSGYTNCSMISSGKSTLRYYFDKTWTIFYYSASQRYYGSIDLRRLESPQRATSTVCMKNIQTSASMAESLWSLRVNFV